MGELVTLSTPAAGPPIPDAALETHIGILGKTGRGKSYTARGLVERLLEMQRQVVVIDPTGAWWGLRSNPAGDGPGFDIPIFGGDHGDVEIGDKAGEAVAGVIVEQRASAVIDLSQMSGGGQRRFMTAFAHRLRAKPRGALYFVVDEADEFMPQNLSPDMTNLFGDLRWIVRRGRLAGFRVMMVTQRPAEIAKAMLTQIETLVAHGLTAPQDRRAIEEWVKGHHDPSEAREVLTTLASLDKGEAWVWSPDLNILTRARQPAITTFDSGRTPEPGEAMPAVALGALDLSAIREALAAADEPAHKPKHIPAPETGKEIAELRAKLAELTEQLTYTSTALAHAESRVAAALAALRSEGALAPQPRESRLSPAVTSPQSRVAAAPAAVERRPKPAADARADGHNPTASAIAALLDRINPARLSWAQAAAMVGRKSTGGNFNAARKWLRGSGRIVEDGDFIRSANDAPAGLSRDQAFDLWRSILTKPAPTMLEVFYGSGTPLPKEALGQAIGGASHGGFFNSGFAQLRNNGLIVAEGDCWSIAHPLPGEAP